MTDTSEATTLHNSSPIEYEMDDLRLEHSVKFEIPEPKVTKIQTVRRLAGHILSVWEALLVVFAYAMSISGTVVYTGACRTYYLNGCLAHLISEPQHHLLRFEF